MNSLVPNHAICVLSATAFETVSQFFLRFGQINLHAETCAIDI